MNIHNLNNTPYYIMHPRPYTIKTNVPHDALLKPKHNRYQL